MMQQILPLVAAIAALGGLAATGRAGAASTTIAGPAEDNPTTAFTGHMPGFLAAATLLAITLAWLAAKKQNRVVSATFFTAQVDFTHAGDLAVFVDEERIKNLEERMKERGYLEASRMATAFNMLRSNDLVWPYIVNNYLRGKKPYPFDILYWNSDATRMPAANHSFYLRNCYLDNKLAKGEMEIAGVKLDLNKVKVPVYNLATREDHIAPWKSTYAATQIYGGPTTFVLSASGHIAGVISPPGSAVPVPGANAGSSTSMSIVRYVRGAFERANSMT